MGSGQVCRGHGPAAQGLGDVAGPPGGDQQQQQQDRHHHHWGEDTPPPPRPQTPPRPTRKNPATSRVATKSPPPPQAQQSKPKAKAKPQAKGKGKVNPPPSKPGGMGYVATLPTSGPLWILPPALKRWGSPRWQGLRSHVAHKWATSDFAPRSAAVGIPEAAGVT